MINNYKALLHPLFLFTFIHALFVIAIHQYQYIGIRSFFELLAFPFNFVVGCLFNIYSYVWCHSAVGCQVSGISVFYLCLLGFSVITISYSVGEPLVPRKHALASAFFGIFVAHVGVSASLAFVENPPWIYQYILLLFNNLILVLMSAVYLLFYVKRFKFTHLKNQIACSVCGFFTGLFFQLLIGSGIFLKYLHEDQPAIRLMVLNFLLLTFSLIIAIFITGFLQKSLNKSFNHSLYF